MGNVCENRTQATSHIFLMGLISFSLSQERLFTWLWALKWSMFTIILCGCFWGFWLCIFCSMLGTFWLLADLGFGIRHRGGKYEDSSIRPNPVYGCMQSIMKFDMIFMQFQDSSDRIIGNDSTVSKSVNAVVNLDRWIVQRDPVFPYSLY